QTCALPTSHSALEARPGHRRTPRRGRALRPTALGVPPEPGLPASATGSRHLGRAARVWRRTSSPEPLPACPFLFRPSTVHAQPALPCSPRPGACLPRLVRPGGHTCADRSLLAARAPYLRSV